MSSPSQRAHAGLPVQNPLTVETLRAGIDRLGLDAGGRVLDVGSGAGDALRMVVERWPRAHGVGIDLLAHPPVHPRVELRVGDARAGLPEGPWAAALCIGSSHALGGVAATLERLDAPMVLLGDGYWRRDPHPDYLAALGATPDELPDRDGLSALVRDRGWREVWSAESSPEDLAAYEEALLRNVDAAGPQDAELAAYGAAIRGWRAAPGGTDTLGFALLALER